MIDTLKLFTGSSTESLLTRGGSGDWRLSAERASQCVYAVCYRNSNGFNAVEAGLGPKPTEPHGAAFLIGRVDRIEPSPVPEYTRRHVVRFSEYALLDGPDYWGGYTNPVRYGNLEEIGIDPERLEWSTMPEANFKPPVRPLTIDEAKAGLAVHLGVREEMITIHIKA